MYHAMLRNSCSDLNNDRYINHLKKLPTCGFGKDDENAEHYFFNFVGFAEKRPALFRSTTKAGYFTH